MKNGQGDAITVDAGQEDIAAQIPDSSHFKGNFVKVEHINAQSLLSKTNDVELLVQEREIDVLCISETWLTNDLEDKYVCFSNYNIYRQDKGRGGGVAIYVRDNLKVNPLNLTASKIDGVEDLWLSIQCRKLPSVIIGCIYRHPHASAESFKYLLDIFREISLRNKPIIVLGDLNENLLQKDNRLSKVISNCNLSQVIQKPTRITQFSSTLLDVILTNKPELILNSDALFHAMLQIMSSSQPPIDIHKPKRKPIIKTFRCQRNYNQNTLCNLLLNDAGALSQIIHTDKQVDLFNDIFKKNLNLCAPTVTREIRRPPAPWITLLIKEKMKIRDDLQRKLKQDRGNLELQEKYKTEKKFVSSLITKSKSEYFRNSLKSKKEDISGTWKIIKSMTPETNQTSANAPTHHFRPHPVDISTVILAIKELNDTKAIGSDGIPLKFLKDALPVIILYITVIINTSIVTGTFPKAWKMAHVLPLFKAGDENENIKTTASSLAVSTSESFYSETNTTATISSKLPPVSLAEIY
ncbi:uncharacterized protein LOC119587991 [Penaeus monodon]|uniref:uncharacterized protein LOC119587991 n=1 Tax=Penaeus monodon TaxID=6687 RepID=UPI0018A7C72C|nr:uncharacterized protein LOC119587991 [Penaeus monodon]